jgi:hypothetical protein
MEQLGWWPGLLLHGTIWGVWHAPPILLSGYNYPGHHPLGAPRPASCLPDNAHMQERDGGSDPNALAQTSLRPELADRWEYLETRLGRPSDPHAWQRQRELLAQGWEFLGVRFRQGLWAFRRPQITPGPDSIWSERGTPTPL